MTQQKRPESAEHADATKLQEIEVMPELPEAGVIRLSEVCEASSAYQAEQVFLAMCGAAHLQLGAQDIRHKTIYLNRITISRLPTMPLRDFLA